MQNSSEKIVVQVRKILHDLVTSDYPDQKLKLSAYLSEQLNYEYNYLSTLFSEVEGITIEKYYIKVKVDRVKELIDCNKYTLNEIAHQMGYSSPAHLTNQFKSVTDQTPSQYKTRIHKSDLKEKNK